MAVTYSQNGTIVRTVMPTDAVSTRRIDSEQGINVVDENGYIGAVVTDYFPHTGNTYYNNFAIVINHADFSESGLGQVTFVTLGTADIGGRTYRTVTIGNQTWMAENLDYKFSGCAIGTSGSATEPCANYYDNNETAYGIDGTYKCGLLYNWPAAKFLSDNRAVLTPGWHVPSETEWDTLVNTVGGYTANTSEVLRAKNNSVTSNWPSWGGVDSYDFSALPGGIMRWTSSTQLGDSGMFRCGNANQWIEFSGTSIWKVTPREYEEVSIRLVRDAT